tara:strand:+ start:2542 stop:4416 length:1875 start_codon:yes stop_codon:yes gene_type:complete
MIKSIKKSNLKYYSWNPNILYADIETVFINNIHQPIGLGYSNITGTKSNIHLLPYDCVDIKNEFLKIVTQFIEESKNSTVYFHNLSSFDGFLLLKCLYNILPVKKIHFIEKNNIIYQITFNDTIIKDSFLLFPESLYKLSVQTNKYYTKMNFDYSTIKAIWATKPIILRMVLKNDVMCLHESFTTLNTLLITFFGINVHKKLSLSSLSFELYRERFYKTSLINKNSRKKDLFFRKSYFGGVPHLYGTFLQNGYHYDINNLYPAVMCFDMPLTPIKTTEDKLINLINNFGFLEVKIVTPKLIFTPCLPKKDDIKGTINPTGTWKGMYFSEELKIALSLGYKISVIKTYGYKRGKIFSNYIKFFYKIRKLYSKKNLLNKISKLLLNSLYGRFGMHVTKSTKKIIDAKKLFHIKKRYKIDYYKPLNKNAVIFSYTDKNNTTMETFSNNIPDTAVQIAMSITSYARIFLYKYQTLPNNFCYYSDTDSVFLQKRVPRYLTGIDLGKLRTVHKIKHAYFISLKSYIYLSNTNSFHLKFKGLTKTEQQNLSPSFFYSFFVEKPFSEKTHVILRSEFFFKEFSSLNLLKRNILIKLKISFDKRVKSYENKKWTATRPIDVPLYKSSKKHTSF